MPRRRKTPRPRPIFDPQINEEARAVLRATLGQLMSDIEAIDADLSRLHTKVANVHEIDFLPVLVAIGRAADGLGDAMALSEDVFDNLDDTRPTQ
jgi:hypothetical protein